MSKKSKLDSNYLHSSSSVKDSSVITSTSDCGWCQKSLSSFSPSLITTSNNKFFCSVMCFTYYRKACLKKNKTCDWCKHVRHNVRYIDYKFNNQWLQFCGRKCLHQYTMNTSSNSFQVTTSFSSNDLLTGIDLVKSCDINQVNDQKVNEPAVLVYHDNLLQNTLSNSKRSLNDKNEIKWQSNAKIVSTSHQSHSTNNLRPQVIKSASSSTFLKTSDFSISHQTQLIVPNQSDNLELLTDSINRSPFSTTKPAIALNKPLFNQNSFNPVLFECLLKSLSQSHENKLPSATASVPYPFLIPITIPIPIPIPILVPFNLQTKSVEPSLQEAQGEPKQSNNCDFESEDKSIAKNELTNNDKNKQMVKKIELKSNLIKRNRNMKEQNVNSLPTSLENLFQIQTQSDPLKSTLTKRFKK